MDNSVFSKPAFSSTGLFYYKYAVTVSKTLNFNLVLVSKW